MVAAIIILAICVPITSLVTGYFAFKGVQYGLRWQMQAKNEQMPTMDPVSVPSPFTSSTPEDQAKQMLGADTYDEWVNWPKEVKA